MSTTNGTMKSFKVTDPQGNVYIMTPVDTTARTTASTALSTANEAAEAIGEAKSLTFDEDFFNSNETQDEVSIGLNGVPIGVDSDTPLEIVQDTQAGLVFGVDSPFQTVIAPKFDSTSTYVMGNYVMHKSKYYRCANDIPVAKDWDEADWTETSVDEILGNISSVLDTVNTAIETVSHAGMYDLGNKTESDLVSGKLSISSGNSTTKLTLTSVNALTVLANSGVPNFALLIDNSGNSNNVVVTVKDSTDTTNFLQSVSAGNEVTAGKIFQLTCVGNCWTLAEFGTANA